MSNELDRNKSEACEAFVQLLTGEQTRLFGYLATLLGDVNEASNVLQQTNMVLWRKADEFDLGSNFSAWARKIAYFQTLAYLRDKKRDKHIFDDRLLEQLASRPETVDEDERRVALRHCLAGVSSPSLELLRQRYTPGNSVAEMARQRNKSEGSIRMALMRIRHSLVECIERQLANTY